MGTDGAYLWVMALPYRVGIGSAWCAGLILDILEGSVLGLNAIGLVIVAYVTSSIHLRFRMFSSIQQSGLVLVLLGINLFLMSVVMFRFRFLIEFPFSCIFC